MTGSSIAQLTLAHHHRPVQTSPSGPPRRPGWYRGVALVEFAVVLVPLILIIFTSIDLARYAKFQNRLTASAREGAAIAGYYPGWIGPGTSSSCATLGTQGRNVYDRALSQDPDLATYANFAVIVRKLGTTTPISPGCRNGMPTGVAPGDRLVVEVRARFSTVSPLTKVWWGSSVLITKSATVTVLGAAP